MIEKQNFASESILVGKRTIELVRPLADSIALPEDSPEPQLYGQIEALVIAKEQGPCGGVDMAEAVMDKLIANRDAVNSSVGIFANHPPSKSADRAWQYGQAGVQFATPIEDVPEGSIYLFSAHGADPAEKDAATARNLHVVDTTCPLVGHVYRAVERAAAETDPADSLGVVYVATRYERDHPEVRGTRGVAATAGAKKFIPVTSVQEAQELARGKDSVGPESMSLAGLKRVVVTGLTTNNDAVTREVADAFMAEVAHLSDSPEVVPYNERSVCRTVRVRQEAVRQMVREESIDTLIILGAIGSNNTQELVGAALDEVRRLDHEDTKLRTIIFANTYKDLPELSGRIGLASGASTQNRNVAQVIDRLNVPSGSQKIIGDTDKDGRFLPLGGKQSLARRILNEEFGWLTIQGVDDTDA